MAYVQELEEQQVPKMRKSFIEVATAELLDPTRTTEPKDFKKNYPHYNFNDDTTKAGSTRFDSSFKNHGADELEPSDLGLVKNCLPCRPKKVIAVPKQKIPEAVCCCDVVPEKVVLKPRPYEPTNSVYKVPFCKPIETIVDSVPHVAEEKKELMDEIQQSGCVNCYTTEDELKDAIKSGVDPYDGVLVGSTVETKPALATAESVSVVGSSKPKKTTKAKTDETVTS